MTESTRRDIAMRLRGLIGGQTADLSECARLLGVDEVSLRISTDNVSPYPTLDVLSAAVAHYGIDPTYLLTGQYDSTSHRRVLDDPGVADEVLRKLTLVKPERLIADPATERPNLHIA